MFKRKLKLPAKSIKEAKDFLQKVKSYSPLAERLPFHKDASVFVSIPLYQEFSNAKKLFFSYYQQKMPKDVRCEVIFLINNKQDSPEEVVLDNTETYNLLLSLAKKNSRKDMGFHVIDCFSPKRALSPKIYIGGIRNIAHLFVVNHALETRRNGIILSTDADTRAENELIAELHKIFMEHGTVFGLVNKKLEYADFNDEEIKKIELIFLVHSVRDMVVDYLSYNRWEEPDLFGGCNSFYSIDAFLGIGGYVNDNELPEDFDLAHRLKQTFPEQQADIVKELLVNIIRVSDRLSGDGAILLENIRNDFEIPFSAHEAVAHARLRKWLHFCLANEIPYDEGKHLLREGEVFAFLPSKTRISVQKLLNSGDETSGTEKYWSVYDGVIRLIHNDYLVSLDESINSFSMLISHIIDGDEKFEKLANEFSTSHQKNAAVLHALVQYVSDTVQE